MIVILTLVIACIAWTVTKEEIFREPRDHCKKMSLACRYLVQRKFFYLFTCEYCFSHYVAALSVFVTGYQVQRGVVGFFLTVFLLVMTSNIVMSLFALLRQIIKLVGNKAKIAEANAKLADYQLPPHLKEGK